jgi:hypothetical protein
MRKRTSVIAMMAVMVVLGTVAGCSPNQGPGTTGVDNATPQSEFTLGLVKVSVLSISLRSAYSTYYLMTHSGPDHVFLVLEMAIDGVEDPLGWAEAHLSLEANGEVFSFERIRPILTNEEVEYRADFNFEYVYELIWRIPREAEFEQLWIGFDDQREIRLSQFSDDLLIGEFEASTEVIEPAGSALSGEDNLAVGEQSVVAGGSDNQALAIHSAVCGGSLNVAAVSYAFVGGGRENRAELFYATIGGGYGNLASARETTVCGGSRNEATDRYATITGGIRNQASAPESTIAGGSFNQASDVYAAVAGGTRNQAAGYGSFVGAGAGNTADGDYAVIAGGLGNESQAEYTFIGGGHANQSMGDYASVLGGTNNVAGSDFSLAIGSNIHILSEHQGAILMADSLPVAFLSQQENELAVRATGGVRLVTSINADGDPMSGAILPEGGGAWSQLSDRMSKIDIESINPQMVLNSLLQLPLYSWRYASQPGSIRHMGPMAQDFYAAFGVGEDPRYINSLDADGVALTSIQALAIQVQQQAEQINQLESRLESSSLPYLQAVNILSVLIIGGFVGWWLRSKLAEENGE